MASEDQGVPPEELPGQQNMFIPREGDSKKSAGKKRGPVHLKGTRSLERLRDRIDLAVKELHRLRDDNQALRKEVESLKSRSAGTVDGTPVVFTEGASALRSKVESYISIIDRYVEREENSAQKSD